VRSDAAAGDAIRGGLPNAVRVSSHIAVWNAVLTPTIVVLSKGWVATGDDAAIAIRSYQTFSFHPPLVGLASTASGGHGSTIYDPGPLLFWLLAIPVRIDPTYGPLWGAALWSGAALSTAVEAIWRTRVWIGCAVIGLVALDYLLFVPQSFENLIWNAYFPIPFFVAAIALAWIVGSGSYSWWPVLVVAGSVAAQCQLIYLLPAIALVVMSPLIGLAMQKDLAPAKRPLVVGAFVGLLCWIVPLIQNFGSNGNLSALVRSGQGQPRLGPAIGLRVVALIASPRPLPFTSLPKNSLAIFDFVHHGSVTVGLVIILLLALSLLVSKGSVHFRLTALISIALVSVVMTLTSFAIIPKRNVLSLSYVLGMVWAVSALVWAALLWSLAVACIEFLRKRRTAVPGPARLQLVAGIGSVVLLGVGALVGILSLRSFVPSVSNVGLDAHGIHSVTVAAEHIEQRTPRGPVALTATAPADDSFAALDIVEGVAWRLEADGWQPGLYGFLQEYTGLLPPPTTPAFSISIADERVRSIQTTACPPLPSGCRQGP
jgi:hypothetical protein